MLEGQAGETPTVSCQPLRGLQAGAPAQPA